MDLHSPEDFLPEITIFNIYNGFRLKSETWCPLTRIKGKVATASEVADDSLCGVVYANSSDCGDVEKGPDLNHVLIQMVPWGCEQEDLPIAEYIKKTRKLIPNSK